MCRTDKNVLPPHLFDGYSKPAVLGWARATKYCSFCLCVCLKRLGCVCVPRSGFSLLGVKPVRVLHQAPDQLPHLRFQTGPGPGPWPPGPGVDQRGARPWPTLCYQTGPEHRRHNYTVIPVKRRAALWQALVGTVEMTHRWLITLRSCSLRPRGPSICHYPLSPAQKFDRVTVFIIWFQRFRIWAPLNTQVWMWTGIKWNAIHRNFTQSNSRRRGE